MGKPIEDLRMVHAIHSQSGNWNYDPYMHGMMNGLELALATMEERDPKFWDAPDEWLSERTVENVDTEPASEQRPEGDKTDV